MLRILVPVIEYGRSSHAWDPCTCDEVWEIGVQSLHKAHDRIEKEHGVVVTVDHPVVAAHQHLSAPFQPRRQR
jgi:hypothetical protein